MHIGRFSNMVTLAIYLVLNLIAGSFCNDMITSHISSTYDWDSRSSMVTTSCINIPKNLSLCSNIGYDRMRLPNLLQHDTLSEVSQQAASWVPLMNVGCHPDTQRFICSLFCPVCLDHAIYPCRSLCEKVKGGCEARMKSYGYPWPEMFTCSQFPQDNDMCITAESASDSSSEEKCKICEQVNTVENILDYYCQSDFAVRGKLKKYQHNSFVFKKVKLFKSNSEVKKELNGELFHFNLTEECCREKLKLDRGTYFIMGKYQDKKLVPTFIMPWVVKQSKSFKKSIKMLKTINCSNPEAITRSIIETSSVPSFPLRKASKKLSEKTTETSTTKIDGSSTPRSKSKKNRKSK